MTMTPDQIRAMIRAEVRAMLNQLTAADREAAPPGPHPATVMAYAGNTTRDALVQMDEPDAPLTTAARNVSGLALMPGSRVFVEFIDPYGLMITEVISTPLIGCNASAVLSTPSDGAAHTPTWTPDYDPLDMINGTTITIPLGYPGLWHLGITGELIGAAVPTWFFVGLALSSGVSLRNGDGSDPAGNGIPATPVATVSYPAKLAPGTSMTGSVLQTNVTNTTQNVNLNLQVFMSAPSPS